MIMAPKESTPLISSPDKGPISQFSFGAESRSDGSNERYSGRRLTVISVVASLIVLGAVLYHYTPNTLSSVDQAIGPYKLVERQEGNEFFSFYDFLDGPDSLGSAGYNNYVGEDRARELGLINVTAGDEGEFVYIMSAPTDDGPRESIRLEGKRRFDRGLFLLDVEHMPAGCGVWPAFWLTDEANWPDNGEIDVVEGINNQTVAKTALHTSESCSMFAHVSPWNKTGVWDTATGLPDTFTGEPNLDVKVTADNCWVMAPHQWANQGCVAVNTDNNTIGKPMNEVNGGIYALEWDPANRYIRSWVFPRNREIPENLQRTIHTASDKKEAVTPHPEEWGLPYAYFAIGEGTGCSSDHFQNMRIVINLAFCGTVSGNRFLSDCPKEAAHFLAKDKDPIASCNSYIASSPEDIEEAFWKIKGVYVYEREPSGR